MEKWIIVLVVVLVLVFGLNKLPQLGRNMGEGIKEFKKGVSPEEEAAQQAQQAQQAIAGPAPAAQPGGTQAPVTSAPQATEAVQSGEDAGNSTLG